MSRPITAVVTARDALATCCSCSLLCLDHADHAGPAAATARRWTASARRRGACSARSERVAAAIAGPVGDAVDGVGDLGDGRDRGRPAEQGERRAPPAAAHHRATTATGPPSSTTCSSVAGAGRYTRRAGPGHRDRPGAELRLDRHDRRRQPGRHPAGHDRAQRRRPGRPGQDGRTDRPRPCCSSSTPTRRSACGSRARWSSASPPARAWRRRRPRPAAARRRSRASSAGDRLVTFGSQGDAPYVPGSRSARSSRSGAPGLADPHRDGARRTSTSPSLDLVGVVVEPPRSRPARRRAAAAARRADAGADRDGHRDRRAEAGRADVPAARSRWPSLLVIVALAVQVDRAVPAAAARRDPGPRAARRRRAGARLRARLRAGLRASAAGLVLDLVPPADHEVGRWALVLTLVGYLAGLARDETRRSRVRAAGRRRGRRRPARSCCTPGSAP